MVKLKLKDIKKEGLKVLIEEDEDLTLSDIVEEMDIYFNDAIPGLKALGIKYSEKTKTIILPKGFDVDVSMKIIDDYFNVINDENIDFEKISLKDFFRVIKNKERAELAFEYYNKSGAKKADDEELFDNLGTYMVINLEIIEKVLKKK